MKFGSQYSSDLQAIEVVIDLVLEPSDESRPDPMLLFYLQVVNSEKISLTPVITEPSAA